MKKRVMAVSLVFAVLVVSGFLIVRSINSDRVADSERIEGYYSSSSRQITFGPGRIFHINANDVARIEIACGSTGERVHVEDRDEIAGIVRDMNNIQYSEKETLSERWIGFSLAVTLYDDSDQIITSFVPRGDTLEVNGELRYTFVRLPPFGNFLEKYFG